MELLDYIPKEQRKDHGCIIIPMAKACHIIQSAQIEILLNVDPCFTFYTKPQLQLHPYDIDEKAPLI